MARGRVRVSLVISVIDKDAVAHGRDLAETIAGIPDVTVRVWTNVAVPPIQDGRAEHRRFFFPLTELTGSHPRVAWFLRRVGLRKPVRYVEMVWGYARAALSSVLNPGPVVVSMSRYFAPEDWFVGFVSGVVGRRVVVVAHEIPDSPDPGDARVSATYRRAVRMFARSAAVVVHGPSMRRRLERLLTTGGVRCRIITFPHPRPAEVPPEATSLSAWRADLLGARNFRGGTLDVQPRLVFGFVGSIRPNKGLGILLRSWCGCLAGDPEVALVVAGRPTYDVSGEIQVAGEAGATNVYWKLEQLTDEELLAFFASVDVVVLPYLQGSQSGIMALATSYGKPCLVTDVGDLARSLPPGLHRDWVVPDPSALPGALERIATLTREQARHVGDAVAEYRDPDSVDDQVRTAMREVLAL